MEKRQSNNWAFIFNNVQCPPHLTTAGFMITASDAASSLSVSRARGASSVIAFMFSSEAASSTAWQVFAHITPLYSRRPNLTKWGTNNTPPEGQLFLNVEILCWWNLLELKRSVGGRFSLCKQQPIWQIQGVFPFVKSFNFQKIHFPSKILFAFNGFLSKNSSSFRNNWPSGGVLLDPHFVNLGRRVVVDPGPWPWAWQLASARLLECYWDVH